MFKFEISYKFHTNTIHRGAAGRWSGDLLAWRQAGGGGRRRGGESVDEAERRRQCGDRPVEEGRRWRREAGVGGRVAPVATGRRGGRSA
jgi:hypothetical protein